MKVKLTPTMLKKIIEEEAAKFGKERDTEMVADDSVETDADELAGSLEKHIDFVRALKIEEARLVKRLKKIREQRDLVRKSLIKKI